MMIIWRTVVAPQRFLFFVHPENWGDDLIFDGCIFFRWVEIQPNWGDDLIFYEHIFQMG